MLRNIRIQPCRNFRIYLEEHANQYIRDYFLK